MKLRSLFATLAGLFISLPSTATSLVGQPAPDFRLQDQAGEWHTPEQYRGQWVVLYFYPKDDTPGCTTEAKAFRDSIEEFADINAVVIGVSLDDVDSKAAFAEKYDLPFPILADVDKQAAESYNVIMKIGSMTLAKRETFLIGPDGVIARHYPQVKPDTHTGEVLDGLRTLGAGADT